MPPARGGRRGRGRGRRGGRGGAASRARGENVVDVKPIKLGDDDAKVDPQTKSPNEEITSAEVCEVETSEASPLGAPEEGEIESSNFSDGTGLPATRVLIVASVTVAFLLLLAFFFIILPRGGTPPEVVSSSKEGGIRGRRDGGGVFQVESYGERCEHVAEEDGHDRRRFPRGYVDYLYLFDCVFGVERRVLGYGVMAAWLAVLFYLLGDTAAPATRVLIVASVTVAFLLLLAFFFIILPRGGTPPEVVSSSKEGGIRGRRDGGGVFQVESYGERCEHVAEEDGHDRRRFPRGYVDYLYLFDCVFGVERRVLGYGVMAAWLAVLFYLLGDTAAVYFCSSLKGLSWLLRLSRRSPA
ncbi:hypothetical protein OsI_04664 [Oryza sativa Indica Group]|uniref:Uncharacterized protein n=1 Tax=Oryza sativa subsp. indica TaxID=39946 RepID=A2WXL3_ORYSI|nr:hypothetical protein OsI_04664 [Oryza sativa Indica Group]